MSMPPAPLSSSVAAVPVSPVYLPMWTSSLTTRYADAYRKANAQTSLGSAIKVISLVIGGLISLASLSFALDSATPQAGFFGTTTNSVGIALGMFGTAGGVVIGGIGFILGTIVASHGQVLKATLDTAVNTSPFLKNNERAGIMSI